MNNQIWFYTLGWIEVSVKKVSPQLINKYNIRHLCISHYTPCLSPKVLYSLCFSFLLSITVVPKDCFFFFGGGGGGQGVSWEMYKWKMKFYTVKQTLYGIWHRLPSLRGHHLDLTFCGKYLERIQITYIEQSGFALCRDTISTLIIGFHTWQIDRKLKECDQSESLSQGRTLVVRGL